MTLELRTNGHNDRQRVIALRQSVTRGDRGPAGSRIPRPVGRAAREHERESRAVPGYVST